MDLEFHCRMKCCLKSLIPLTSKSAKVEVKASLPKSFNKVKDQLAVHWKKNGEAVFHPECWNKLVQAAKRRATYKSSSPRKKNGSAVKDVLKLLQCEKLMIKEAKETEELFDAEEDIIVQAKCVAAMIKSSNHCVFFTGAGVSTAAGLGDFRGKGGKWTEEDRKPVETKEETTEDADEPPPAKRARSVGKKNASTSTSERLSTTERTDLTENEEEEPRELDYEELRPTLTHEVVRGLVEGHWVKHLISQNCDGLHRLSGIQSSNISELHGNVFMERCESCNKEYQRPFYVCDDISDLYLEEVADFGKSDIIVPKFMKKCNLCELSHRTGRRCEVDECKGYLADTIINFGDDLEADVIGAAFGSAESCDLLVCLGTTLAVTPANSLVHKIKKPQRIVICNRQATEKDRSCQKHGSDGKPLGARVHGDCDVFMKHVMRGVLGEEGYQAFLDKLPARRELYDTQRTASSNNSI